MSSEHITRFLRVERQIQRVVDRLISWTSTPPPGRAPISTSKRVVDRLVALMAERRRLLEAMGKEEGR